MVVGDINKITASLSPDTPVIFYNSAAEPLSEDAYCDGVAVYPSRMWIGREGWTPCLTVELGQAF